MYLVKCSSLTMSRIVGDSTTLAIDEWMSVLKLSTMWGFHNLRKRATGRIEIHVQNLGAVDLILLARAYRVSAWLMKGYDDLARRDKHITPQERERLGLDTFFRVVELREKNLRHAVLAFRPRKKSPPIEQVDLTNDIQAMFRDELMGDEKYRAAHRD